MQCTSGQFNADLFAMANGQNFTEQIMCIPYTKNVELVKPSEGSTSTTYTFPTKGKVAADLVNYPVTVNCMEDGDGVEAGTYKATVGTDNNSITVVVGDYSNDEEIKYMDVTYYVEQAVKKIDIDNKSTAVGSLIAKWPVYSSGEEGNAGGVKGHLLMHIGKCRITAMPGFDTSYKSAATNSVTFSVMENRGEEAAYSIAYYEEKK
jgi:hypothetical protein